MKPAFPDCCHLFLYQGLFGSRGHTGLKGKKGEPTISRGSKLSGDKGDPGPQGTPGMAGTPGKDGIPGLLGLPGIQVSRSFLNS